MVYVNKSMQFFISKTLQACYLGLRVGLGLRIRFGIVLGLRIGLVFGLGESWVLSIKT